MFPAILRPENGKDCGLLRIWQQETMGKKKVTQRGKHVEGDRVRAVWSYWSSRLEILLSELILGSSGCKELT